ncbi:M10 family metallopeptidase [Acuticoccus sediminis]|uniref:M10 family metallopeptidase n=1 Tax=Acuticoccus sediminis TaxID=2184697 RepID=UPI001CFED1B6|nr:M10 family metallopeptidase C-terminal domain-containing protein [Acuticoccus sediminis]
MTETYSTQAAMDDLSTTRRLTTPGDDPGDTPATAAPLFLDTPVRDSIVVRSSPSHPAYDADWYAFEFQAGRSYDISLNAVRVDGRSLSDPYLRLVDADGNVVAENDDANGRTLNAALTVSFTETATCYVVPDSFYDSDRGGYRLEITRGDASDPLAAIDWGVRLDRTEVTVYFAAAGEVFDFTRNQRTWTDYERQQVFEALGTYEDVSRLRFVETDASADADFVLLQGRNGSALGWFNPPDPDLSGRAGVGWFNNSSEYWSNESGGLLERGSSTFLTFLHEFGHGLGLAHPHDRGGDSTVIRTRGSYGLDQGVYTVMSYNDGWPEGPNGASRSDRFGYNLTPAALDIALIQEKYGANANHNAGDDIYTLPTVNGPGTGYSTVWDVGGTDAIVAEDTARDVVIDLRAATLGGSEDTGGGGFVSYADGIFGGITIAAGVVIENAAGGSGDDRLVGNAAGNALAGAAGADTLSGGAGDDTLDGGAGADEMEGGSGNDTYIVDQSGDRVIEFEGGGTDMVRSAAADLDLADYENIEHVGLMGENDLAVTGDGADNFILGNAGDNVVAGGAGRDNVRSGRGDDVVRGGAGNDIILAQAGDDTLFGNGGRDNIRGGDGADVMTGGAGGDRFLIGPDQGSDTIRDFEAGVDKVHLAALTLGGYAALSGLMDNTSSGVLIAFDAASSLLMEGLRVADLSAGDFIL